MGKYVLISLTVAILLIGIVVTSNAQQNTDVWIPGIASFCIPGFGQLLNDEMSKAAFHFGVDVALWVGGLYLASLLSDPGFYGYSLIGLAHVAWSLYSAYDAYTVAKERGFSIGLTQEGIALSYRL
jgi:hypothetical protein